jgi:hypothetical protein
VHRRHGNAQSSANTRQDVVRKEEGFPVVLAALFAAFVAVTAAKPVPWVVLVRNDGAAPASWSESLQEAARAAGEGTAVRVLPAPAISPEEASLTLGCGGFTSSCAGKIAGTLGAQVALVVELKAGDGDGPVLTTSVVSSSGSLVRPAETAELPDRGELGLKVARRYVVAAIRGSKPTIVVVTTDTPGATVLIDGARRGRTPLTLVDEVPPGEHKLHVSLDGRAPITKAMDIKVGQTHRFDLVLGANPVPSVKPTIGEQPTTSAVSPAVAWSVLGVGAATLAVGGVVGAVLGGRVIALEIDRSRLNSDGNIVGITQRESEEADKFNLELGKWALGISATGALVAATGGALFLLVDEEPPPAPEPPPPPEPLR